MKKSPLDRVLLLSNLRANHVITPDFGIVNDLAARHGHQDFCIVWYANHHSERMRLGDANDRFPKNYAVMFRGTTGVSYRVVHIGENAYWTMWKNVGGWNSADGAEIYIKSCYQKYHPTIRLPWFSIDYAHVVGNDHVVLADESCLCAIDFTPQPGIRNSVITKHIDRRKAASLLKRARRYFERKTC